MIIADNALRALWSSCGGEPEALQRIRLTGRDPVLPSSFRAGTIAQVSIAASALAATQLHMERGGVSQSVHVDMLHAAIEFLSERYIRIPERSFELMDPIAGAYPCKDQRWVRVHTNFGHHLQALVKLLGCKPTRESVAEAMRHCDAQQLEDDAPQRGAIVAMMRSRDEWNQHPQALALHEQPIVMLEKIADSSLKVKTRGLRPLSDVRVLDLTRIIAGPVAGRALAAHGADVLTVSANHLPSIEPLVIDTGRGKRSCVIDLNDADDCSVFEQLIADADVLIQGYRPGGLAARGFGAEQATAVNPNLVYVSLSAYGHCGPWSDRRGFDSIVQTATGFNHDEANALGVTEPTPLPCQALDHASGYLLAFGAIMGLRAQAKTGGAWHVRVSLARTGQWLSQLGRLNNGFDASPLSNDSVQPFLQTTDSGFGPLTAVRHAAILSETPAHWVLPSVPLGAHAPVWASL